MFNWFRKEVNKEKEINYKSPDWVKVEELVDVHYTKLEEELSSQESDPEEDAGGFMRSDSEILSEELVFEEDNQVVASDDPHALVFEGDPGGIDLEVHKEKVNHDLLKRNGDHKKYTREERIADLIYNNLVSRCVDVQGLREILDARKENAGYSHLLPLGDFDVDEFSTPLSLDYSEFEKLVVEKVADEEEVGSEERARMLAGSDDGLFNILKLTANAMTRRADIRRIDQKKAYLASAQCYLKFFLFMDGSSKSGAVHEMYSTMLEEFVELDTRIIGCDEGTLAYLGGKTEYKVICACVGDELVKFGSEGLLGQFARNRLEESGSDILSAFRYARDCDKEIKLLFAEELVKRYDGFEEAAGIYDLFRLNNQEVDRMQGLRRKAGLGELTEDKILREEPLRQGGYNEEPSLDPEEDAGGFMCDYESETLTEELIFEGHPDRIEDYIRSAISKYDEKQRVAEENRMLESMYSTIGGWIKQDAPEDERSDLESVLVSVYRGLGFDGEDVNCLGFQEAKRMMWLEINETYINQEILGEIKDRMERYQKKFDEEI